MSEEYDKLSNSVAQLLSEKVKLNEQEHENFIQLQNLPIVRKLQSSVDFLRNETHKLHQQKIVLLNKVRLLTSELQHYKNIDKNKVTLEIKEIEACSADLNEHIIDDDKEDVKNVLIEDANQLNNLNNFYSILGNSENEDFTVLVQGVQVPLDASLINLYQQLCHPDHFLYVIIHL